MMEVEAIDLLREFMSFVDDAGDTVLMGGALLGVIGLFGLYMILHKPS